MSIVELGRGERLSPRALTAWARHITIWRALLALLLLSGWIWQGRQHLSVVEVYFTAPHATAALAPRVRQYPAGTPWICLYFVYAQARPGVDRYTYRFAQGTSVFFQDTPHRVSVTHGVALDCFATGGALPPGHYVADLLVDGALARRLPLVVAAKGARR